MTMDPFQFWWSRFQHAGTEQFNHWTLFFVVSFGMLAGLMSGWNSLCISPRLRRSLRIMIVIAYLVFGIAQTVTLNINVQKRNHARDQIEMLMDKNGQLIADRDYPGWEKSLDPLNRSLITGLAIFATLFFTVAFWLVTSHKQQCGNATKSPEGEEPTGSQSASS